MAKQKLIPMQVVVSIPRAGEFITTIQLDPAHSHLSYDPLQAGDVNNRAIKLAMDKVKITPLKGETKRVLSVVRALRKETK